MTVTIPDLHLIEHLDWQPACSNDRCKRPATHVMHMACGCAMPCCLPCALKVKHEADRAEEYLRALGARFTWSCTTCHRMGTTYPILRIEPLT